MAGEMVQGEFHRRCGVTGEAFALQQLRKLQQCVLFIVDEEQLLARSM